MVVFREGREEGDGDEGQAEIFGDIVSHVSFVDEHGVEIGFTNCVGSVAEDHAGGVLHPLDCETKSRESAKFAQALVELLERARRIVGGADWLEVDAGSADAGFCVGDSEDDDFVSAPFQTARECSHWIYMSGAGEAECSEPRHGSHPSAVRLGPRRLRIREDFGCSAMRTNL